MVERHDQRHWQDMVRTCRASKFFDRVLSMPEQTGNFDAPACSGELILLLFNLNGSAILVRRRGRSDRFSPMVQIGTGEDIVDAARRNAIETGVKIEPVGVPLGQRVTLPF